VKLPAWWAEAERKRQQRLKTVLGPAMQPVDLPVRDSPHTAPGWREVGMYFTMVHPPGFEPVDWCVKVLRRAHPDLVPLWVNWVFRSPADEGDQEVCFGRHAVARIVPDPHGVLEPLRIEALPLYGNRVKPTILEAIFQGPRDKSSKWSDLPGAYKPFDWEVLGWILENYGVKTEQEIYEAKVARPARAKAAAAKQKAEEDAYIRRDLDRFVEKQLAKVSEVEMKEWSLRDLEKSDLHG
jgi:hypothetical protein